MNSKILITGGAGFIGANFIYSQINARSRQIINLDRLTYAGNLVTLSELQSHPQHIFVRGDIRDRQLVDSLLARYRPQAIINFAAETHVDRSIDSPANFIETNINGTFHLLESARQYWNTLDRIEREKFRFLQVSTDEVYGSLSPTDLPCTETTAHAATSPYSASKAAGEALAERDSAEAKLVEFLQTPFDRTKREIPGFLVTDKNGQSFKITRSKKGGFKVTPVEKDVSGQSRLNSSAKKVGNKKTYKSLAELESEGYTIYKQNL